MKLITHGISVSVKVSVKAIARIITDPVEDGHRFEEGDILITRQTDVSFYPLMVIASAMVGEIGGMTCHMASVARELNKPAVVGATNATNLIVDGETIFFDGDTGEISRE